MSEPAPPRGGYTLRLAVRHLATGFLRPRSSMREALAAGLDERRRVSLFATGTWLSSLSYPTVREGFATYIDLVRSSQTVVLYAQGVAIILALMFLVAWLFYAIGCLILYGAVVIMLRPERAFATTRSVIALGAWITTLPISIIAVFGLPIAVFPTLPPESWAVAVILAPIIVSFCMACVAEAFGSSFPRSALVAFLAVAGGTVAEEGFGRALNLLIEIVRGLDVDDQSA